MWLLKPRINRLISFQCTCDDSVQAAEHGIRSDPFWACRAVITQISQWMRTLRWLWVIPKRLRCCFLSHTHTHTHTTLTPINTPLSQSGGEIWCQQRLLRPLTTLRSRPWPFHRSKLPCKQRTPFKGDWSASHGPISMVTRYRTRRSVY
jgi:hypothetical protein